MASVECSSSLATHIKSKPLLYMVDGYIYYKSTESEEDHLYCYNYYEIKCPASIIVDQRARQGEVLSQHSHSTPSHHFWKQFNTADYDVIDLPYKMFQCRLKSCKRRLQNCRYCQMTFDDFALLRQHEKQHEIKYRPFWKARKVTDGKVKTEFSPADILYHPSVTCNYCNHKFVTPEELEEHSKMFLYHCVKCNNCFTRSSYLLHQNSCRKTKTSTKRVINFPRSSPQVQVQVSATNNTPNVDNACKDCQKKFSSKEILLEHNSKYPIFCTTCQTCLESVTEFLKHQTIHKRFAKKNSNVGTKKCKFCGITFDSKNPKKNHVCKDPNMDKFLIINEAAGKTYQCKKCLRYFPSYEQLLPHATFKCKKQRKQPIIETCMDYQIVTPPKRGRPPNKPTGKPSPKCQSQCLRCMQYFINQFELISHQLECSGTYNSCPFCTLWFESPEKVTEHIEECHKCEHCRIMNNGLDDIIYTSRHLLQVHIRRNHEVPCPHCKQTFLSHNILFEHVASNHKCTLCRKGAYFPSKEELTKHLSSVHRVQSFDENSEFPFETYQKKCSFCTKTCASYEEVVKHERKAHPEDVDIVEKAWPNYYKMNAYQY